MYAQLSELVPTKPKAPTIIKVAPKVEEVARYMVRDFHDWTFNDVFPADAGMKRVTVSRSGEPVQRLSAAIYPDNETAAVCGQANRQGLVRHVDNLNVFGSGWQCAIL